MTRAAFALTALFIPLEAIAITLDIVTVMGDHPGIGLGGALWRMYIYFTDLTNTAVLLAALWMVLRRKMVSAPWAAALVVWMVIVGSVYHLLLAPDHPLHGADWLINLIYHTLVPVLIVIWWIIAAPKRALRWHHAIWWLSFPLAYLIYAELRGIETGHYPYFFLDLAQLGWVGLGLWVLRLMAAFLVTGLVVIGLGRVLARLRLSR